MSQRDFMYMIAGVAVGYFVLPMILRPRQTAPNQPPT